METALATAAVVGLIGGEGAILTEDLVGRAVAGQGLMVAQDAVVVCIGHVERPSRIYL